MERVCPLCNSLIEKKLPCRCGGCMNDAGPLADYLGPYSPYFNTYSDSQQSCAHLFACGSCGRCITLEEKMTPVGSNEDRSDTDT